MILKGILRGTIVLLEYLNFVDLDFVKKHLIEGFFAMTTII